MASLVPSFTALPVPLGFSSSNYVDQEGGNIEREMARAGRMLCFGKRGFSAKGRCDQVCNQ